MLDFFTGATQKDAIELITCAAEVCDSSVYTDHMQPAIGSLTEFLKMFSLRDRSVVQSLCICLYKLAHNLALQPDHMESLAAEDLPIILFQILQSDSFVVGREGITAILGTLALMVEISSMVAVRLLEGTPLVPFLRNAIIEANRRAVGDGGTALGAERSNIASEEVEEEQVEEQEEQEAVQQGEPGFVNPGISTESETVVDGQRRTQLTINQLHHVLVLVKNILPQLPEEHPFIVFCRDFAASKGHPRWEWSLRDEWRPYSPSNSEKIERAMAAGANSVTLSIGGHTFVIDFARERQINIHSRGVRRVRRREESISAALNDEALRRYFIEHHTVLPEMIVALIRPLFDMYLSTAHHGIHKEFAHTILRMLFAANNQALTESLKHVAMSSYLAEMLHSRENIVVMSALACAERLLQQQPEIFRIHFRRKGVFYRIQQLMKMRVEAPSINIDRKVELTTKQKATLTKHFLYEYARDTFRMAIEEVEEAIKIDVLAE